MNLYIVNKNIPKEELAFTKQYKAEGSKESIVKVPGSGLESVSLQNVGSVHCVAGQTWAYA